jgi:hypothetical protein
MSSGRDVWGDSIDADIDAIDARNLKTVRTAVAAILFASLVFAAGEAAAQFR